MANSSPGPLTEEEIRKATIGEPGRLDGPVHLVDYDPLWPEQFGREAQRIASALGRHALRIEHIGSTSVPGLVAKPIIDILLVVADSSNEPAYVPALEAAGESRAHDRAPSKAKPSREKRSAADGGL